MSYNLTNSMETITKENAITAYKAFDNKLRCKEFQFEVGKEYTHAGDIRICEVGFHSCLNPFDCLSYYDLVDTRFCEVLIWGNIKTETDSKDTKRCSQNILIKRELSVKEFHSICVEYSIKAVGNSAKNASSGYSAQNASSGNYAKNASSGNYAQNASSGYSAQNASSGDSAQNASSGDYGMSVVTGKNSVDANIGKNSKTMGIIGTWITLAEYDDKGICIMVKSAQIDGVELKENVFYTLKNKQFTEV